MRDTAKTPGVSDDWLCLAVAGMDGVDGRSFVVRGTYRDGEQYKQLDVAAFGGSAFIALKNDPGPCPGKGWQLLASAGKRGEKGERGSRGERGEQGESGREIIGWDCDSDGFIATPILSDGNRGVPLSIRAMFDRYHNDRG